MIEIERKIHVYKKTVPFDGSKIDHYGLRYNDFFYTFPEVINIETIQSFVDLIYETGFNEGNLYPCSYGFDVENNPLWSNT